MILLLLSFPSNPCGRLPRSIELASGVPVCVLELGEIRPPRVQKRNSERYRSVECTFFALYFFRMPHFLDVVVKVVPEGLADMTPSGYVRMGGSTAQFRLDQFVNGEIFLHRGSRGLRAVALYNVGRIFLWDASVEAVTLVFGWECS